MFFFLFISAPHSICPELFFISNTATYPDPSTPRDPIIRAAASMSQGSVSPKREIDNRNLPTTKAATMLGCTPEALMADTVASEGRLGANRVAGVDASSVFQIRQSPSQTPGTVGSNQRTEVAQVPRGTSPTYVPKAGSFSTKIPTHVIQPFVKKG